MPKMQLMCSGARSFNDTVEGTKYDFTKVWVTMENQDKGTVVGMGCIEIPFGTHENLEVCRPLFANGPCELIVDLRLTVKGYEIAGLQRPSAAAQAPKA